jgi:hypothetical protein
VNVTVGGTGDGLFVAVGVKVGVLERVWVGVLDAVTVEVSDDL